MTIQNSKLILLELDKLSDGKLHFRDDLEKLIEIAVSRKKVKDLKKISFDTKFLSGLLGVIKKRNASIDEQYFLKVEEEYKEKLQNVLILLRDLISYGTDFYKSIFEEKFLQLNQQSFENLNFLLADLTFLKLYFNDRRNDDSVV
jgi:hypothetical protein